MTGAPVLASYTRRRVFEHTGFDARGGYRAVTRWSGEHHDRRWRAPCVHVRTRSSATQPRGFATRSTREQLRREVQVCPKDYELRVCPMCGATVVLPPGRVPSIFFVTPGQPMRCQITLDGRVRHRCIPLSWRRSPEAGSSTRARVTRPSPPEATLDAPVICTAVSRRRGSRRFRRVRETQSARG